MDTAEQNPQKARPLDGGEQHQRNSNELHPGTDQLPPGVEHQAVEGPVRRLPQDAKLGGRHPGGGPGEGTERSSAL